MAIPHPLPLLGFLHPDNTSLVLKEFRPHQILHLLTLRGGTILIKFSLSVFLAAQVGLDVLGIYGLIVAISLVFPVIARGGLVNTLSRDLVDANSKTRNVDIIHYAAWVATIYSTIFPLIAFVPIASSQFPTHGLAPLIWGIVFLEHIAVDAVVILNTLRRPQSANLFAFAQAATWAIPYMTVAHLYPECRDLDTLLLFWLGGTAVTLAILMRQFRICPPLPSLLTFAWYKRRLAGSTLLFCNDAVSIISQYLDRYLIAMLFSLDAVGVYTLFGQVSNAIYTLINSSLLQVRRPQLITLFQADRASEAALYHKYLVRDVLTLSAILSIVAGVSMVYLAPYIGRSIIADYTLLLWCILAAYWFRTWMWAEGTRLFAMRQDGRILSLNLVVLILYSVAAIALAMVIGIYAVPLAYSITACIFILLAGLITTRDRKTSAERR